MGALKRTILLCELFTSANDVNIRERHQASSDTHYIKDVTACKKTKVSQFVSMISPVTADDAFRSYHTDTTQKSSQP